MRARRITGAVLFVAGLVLAVCTADGSANEIAMRFAGVALAIAGGIVGGFFDFMEEREEQEEERDKVHDHDPYPMEMEGRR